MFYDESLLSAHLPYALESALETINFVYDRPEQFLGADVSAFEDLDLLVFGYFNRDDVFYVNKAGRALLHPNRAALDTLKPTPPPIFWLDDDRSFRNADRGVIETRCPMFEARELIALHWGKTWLRGVKLPLLSRQGMPIALLFAGHEMPGSEQIRRVASQYAYIPSAIGEN